MNSHSCIKSASRGKASAQSRSAQRRGLGAQSRPSCRGSCAALTWNGLFWSFGSSVGDSQNHIRDHRWWFCCVPREASTAACRACSAARCLGLFLQCSPLPHCPAESRAEVVKSLFEIAVEQKGGLLQLASCLTECV